MEHWQDRTRLLLGGEALEILEKSTVLIVGLGGVGSYAAEMLARAGVGHVILADGDAVSVTNINRQLPAYTDTVGFLKTEIMEKRLLKINPNIRTDRCDYFLDEASIPVLLIRILLIT